MVIVSPIRYDYTRVLLHNEITACYCIVLKRYYNFDDGNRTTATNYYICGILAIANTTTRSVETWDVETLGTLSITVLNLLSTVTHDTPVYYTSLKNYIFQLHIFCVKNIDRYEDVVDFANNFRLYTFRKKIWWVEHFYFVEVQTLNNGEIYTRIFFY